MSRSLGTGISVRVRRHVRVARMGKGWTVTKLSIEMLRHRCPDHPDGAWMSPAVLYNVERGVRGAKAHVREVTVDELLAFSHVLDISVTDLLKLVE